MTRLVRHSPALRSAPKRAQGVCAGFRRVAKLLRRFAGGWLRGMDLNHRPLGYEKKAWAESIASRTVLIINFHQFPLQNATTMRPETVCEAESCMPKLPDESLPSEHDPWCHLLTCPLLPATIFRQTETWGHTERSLLFLRVRSPGRATQPPSYRVSQPLARTVSTA